jgi:metallo-beta-lactamase family protein
MLNNLKLTFYGGTRSVTGANFMLEEVGSSSTKGARVKILVDCGLYQGEKFCEDRSCLDFAYDPAEVQALLVTHAHADHIGRIPKLVHDGFKGIIYSTLETKEIAEIMLNDSLKFILEEAKVRTARGSSLDASKDEFREAGVEPIYNKEDIAKAISLWKDIDYHKDIDLGGGFSAYFKDAGHILGSAIIEVKKGDKKIAFTGDLGNSPTPFLRDTEPITDADYLVMESVYGNREHENVHLRQEKLKNVIEDVIKTKGTLLIPAFSVSRTQILLYELNDLITKGHLPEIPVFLDSPLAIAVTQVYRTRQSNFKDEAKERIAKGEKIFNFPKLKFTESVEDSKAISDERGPKIIIAGSGMSTGGRIMHHEKKYLPLSETTILFVGYQVPGSLGRMIQEGHKEVLINDVKVEVKARVETITGYSGHMDSEGLLNFVEEAGKGGKLKKVFVVMGEPGSSTFLVQKIKDYLEIDAVTPEEGESFELK